MKLNYGTLGYKGISYSRREEFCTCPRKFEISHALGLAKRKDSVTFSYGHAVGAGIQAMFETGNIDIALAQAVRNYSMPWEDEGTAKEQSAKKSLWYALEAVEKFASQRASHFHGGLSYLDDYELIEVGLGDGRRVKGIELEFIIQLEHGFVYEGHIDLVLRHKVDGTFLVLELKTTGLREPNEAQYANSDQALGYSIVLDSIAHSLGQRGAASYEVGYLIFSSSAQQWTLMRFPKSAKMRLNWLNNVMRDVELIHSYQMAAEQGIPYPTRGKSCFEFFRACDYFNLCGMENSTLIRLLGRPSADDQQFEEVSKAHFTFTLEEVCNMQIELAAERTGVSFTTPYGDMTI